MLPIKNLFGFRKNKELDKSIIQKNPYKDNIDLKKRQFIKKGLLGLAGLGGLALASKVAKAGGLVFNDGSNQTVAGNKTVWIQCLSRASDTAVTAMLGDPHYVSAPLSDAQNDFTGSNWTVPDDFTSLTSIEFYWTSTATSGNNVTLAFYGAAAAETEDIDDADADIISLAQYTDDTTALGLNIEDVTAMANALTFTAGHIIGLGMERRGADGSDNLTSIAYALGFRIVYK
tara:strand:+ start:996 stop:1688 length:693 start_codon:yes stop_codon:yes gene_type:complete